MSQQIVISLHENGLPGFAVLTTQKEVQDALQEALDNMSVSMCQRLAEILKEDAVKYFPIIQQGKTYNDGVETIDKTKFDQDLVWIAVYDYIGNGVPISIVKNPTFLEEQGLTKTEADAIYEDMNQETA